MDARVKPAHDEVCYLVPLARTCQSGPHSLSSQLWLSQATPRMRNGCPIGTPSQSIGPNCARWQNSTKWWSPKMSAYLMVPIAIKLPPRSEERPAPSVEKTAPVSSDFGRMSAGEKGAFASELKSAVRSVVTMV